MKGRATASAVLTLALVTHQAIEALVLRPETRDSWEAYVAGVEARIAREVAVGSRERFLGVDFGGHGPGTRLRAIDGEVAVEKLEAADSRGKAMAVPGGLVHHWRGTVFLPEMSLDALLDRLQHPSERGPHQADVQQLRVLRREQEHLLLFIRMTRRELVSVTYDTEHVVSYRRHGRGRASSRSVATKIVEVAETGRPTEAGRDRGFLWRLNSYWRYEQIDGGVLVELESLALSRDVPFGLKLLVEPLVDRVARETVRRTLTDLRRLHRS